MKPTLKKVIIANSVPIVVIPAKAGIQTPSFVSSAEQTLKQQGTIIKKVLWIPHLEASLREESLRQVRNDGSIPRKSASEQIIYLYSIIFIYNIESEVYYNLTTRS